MDDHGWKTLSLKGGSGATQQEPYNEVLAKAESWSGCIVPHVLLIHCGRTGGLPIQCMRGFH